MRTAERGFTLIEVLVALILLGVVVVGMTAARTGLIRSATIDRTASQAAASAEARIALIRQWPEYAALDTFARSEMDTPLPGWNRTTDVRRVGGTGQSNDFKRITVTVSGAGLRTPAARSITVAAHPRGRE